MLLENRDGRRWRASRIVSLFDIMKSFDPAYWMSLVRAKLPEIAGDLVMDEETRKRSRIVCENFKETVEDLGLPASLATVEKTIAALSRDNCKCGDLTVLANELDTRLIDELKGRKFFILSLQEAEIYHRPRDKWQKILGRFPDAGNDVEEAQKCFACSRYTAAVFHSLQIVEIGLIELGKFIGISDPLSGWTAVAQRLKKILDANYQELAQFEKDNRAFLEQVQGTVEGLKNAWRNKVSHAHGKLFVMTGEEFHPDVAEEILIATRAFMRRLAEGLPPKMRESD